MAPKLNSDAAKRNGANGKPAAPTSATQNPYAPSVPIPVYRELAAELQATKAMLESLNAQNQALARQNNLLKQEVQTIVQSAIQLQHLMTPVVPSPPPTEVVPPNIEPQAIAPKPAPAPVAEPVRSAPVSMTDRSPAPETPEATPTAPASIKFTDLPPMGNPDTFFTEQQESVRPSEKASSRQLGGLWLLLVVLAIMVSAFTAGFLVMRPLLLKNSR
jgi:hypothetical protein